MKLKISTPERVVYQGEIQHVILPTEQGNITINEHQKPMVTAIKPGLIHILPRDASVLGEYITAKKEIIISIDKGMVFVDGTIIRVVSAHATTSPSESANNLEKRKEVLQQEIKKLRSEGSIEELERMIVKLQKVEADIALEKIKQHS